MLSFGLHASAPTPQQPKSALSFLIGNVHVDAAMRSRGLGLELLLTALTFEVAGSASLAQMRCTLWVDIDNEAAIRLYEHAGFERTDELHWRGPTLLRLFVRDGAHAIPTSAAWMPLSPPRVSPEHHDHTRDFWRSPRDKANVA